ncbi:MAG: dynamin, partial [Bilophila wadsworthia]
LHTWEDKLRLFSARMDEFSQECLARLSSNIDGLQDDPGEVNGGSSTATHFLVQTHRHMKNLAVFTTGLTVGRLTALGPISILVTAGNIIALAAASPLAAAVFAAVAGTAGLLYHLGREDKRKAAFLDKRRREAEEYAERVCGALRQELAVVREDLGKAYEFEVKRGFAPALESLFHQSVHLRLFLDVMQKIRSDVSRYDTHVQKQLEQLGGVLER